MYYEWWNEYTPRISAQGTPDSTEATLLLGHVVGTSLNELLSRENSGALFREEASEGAFLRYRVHRCD